MHIGAMPETILERLAFGLGMVPTPLVDTSGTFILARMVIAATQLGIFEALAAQALTAAELAAACGTHAGATQQLLDALVSSGYVLAHSDRYRLTLASRRWLLKTSPTSLRDAILFAAIEWDWMSHLSEFIRSGTPLDFHATMAPKHWALYQRAMRSLANIGAPELARRLPVPPGAQTMLDIGGSHGYYSVQLCRRNPGLRATILDLPAAIEHAAPLLAQEHMGDRVTHRAGNTLADDLGSAAYDLVLIAQLVHHFDDAQNRDLVRRAARALRPGGLLAILDAFHIPASKAGGQLASLLNLYFAFTSRSGIWEINEIVAWQRAASLLPQKAIQFLRMPGIVAQVAVKPA
jgi:SAM-dependent methyltransferase